MPNSSERKQALVGWSYNNSGFFSNTQLQKYLFFYELFSKIDGDSYELDGLKGYKNGPVFSAVFGDIRYDDTFTSNCGKAFPYRSHMVNPPRAKLSDFFVKSLGNKLSEFTHMMNIWSAKRERIESGEHNVPLDEVDFTERDAAIMQDIKHAYPESYIDAVKLLDVRGKTFIVYKEDAKRITHRVYSALYEAAFDYEFDSPVYVSFSEMGELLLD